MAKDKQLPAAPPVVPAAPLPLDGDTLALVLADAMPGDVPAFTLCGDELALCYPSESLYTARTSADVEAIRNLRPILAAQVDHDRIAGQFVVSLRLAE